MLPCLQSLFPFLALLSPHTCVRAQCKQNILFIYVIHYFSHLFINELHFFSLSSFRQCASVSPLPSSTPSPGWATATVQWTQSSTHCLWETSNELWGSSCPAVLRSRPEDPHQRFPSLCATQESLTLPVTPLLLWPLIPHTPLPPPLMLSTCLMLSMQGLSCLCFCPIRSTPWIEQQLQKSAKVLCLGLWWKSD